MFTFNLETIDFKVKKINFKTFNINFCLQIKLIT